MRDATVVGGSWNPVANSCMEVNVTGTSVTGGRRTGSGHLMADTSGGSAYGATGTATNLGKNLLWYRRNTVPGTVVLAAVRVGTADSECFGTIAWNEIR